jgi:hypothetical protein
MKTYAFKYIVDNPSIHTKWNEIIEGTVNSKITLEVAHLQSALKIWKDISNKNSLVKAILANQNSGLLTLGPNGTLLLTHSCVVETASNLIIGLQGNNLLAMLVVTLIDQNIYEPIKVQASLVNKMAEGIAEDV